MVKVRRVARNRCKFGGLWLVMKVAGVIARNLLRRTVVVVYFCGSEGLIDYFDEKFQARCKFCEHFCLWPRHCSVQRWKSAKKLVVIQFAPINLRSRADCQAFSTIEACRRRLNIFITKLLSRMFVSHHPSSLISIVRMRRLRARFPCFRERRKRSECGLS